MVTVQQVVTVEQELPTQVVSPAVRLAMQEADIKALDNQMDQLLLVVEEVLEVLGERVLLMVLVA